MVFRGRSFGTSKALVLRVPDRQLLASAGFCGFVDREDNLHAATALCSIDARLAPSGVRSSRDVFIHDSGQ